MLQVLENRTREYEAATGLSTVVAALRNRIIIGKKNVHKVKVTNHQGQTFLKLSLIYV